MFAKEDRFVPRRMNPTELASAAYKLTHDREENSVHDDYVTSSSLTLLGKKPSQIIYGRTLPLTESQQVSFEPSSVVIASSLSPQPKLNCVRALYALGVEPDYYLHPMTCSDTHISIALGYTLHTQDLVTREVAEFAPSSFTYRAIHASRDGSTLLGTTLFDINYYDVATLRSLSKTKDSSQTYGVIHPIDNSTYLLGSDFGYLKVWDVRINKFAASFRDSDSKICGISGNNNGMFAVGDDNHVSNVWDIKQTQKPSTQFTAHTAGVRAIDYHPSRPIIASGGGLACRSIYVWNENTGAIFASAYTGNQVCSLYWATPTLLVSGQGNETALWRYTQNSLRLVYSVAEQPGRILDCVHRPKNRFQFFSLAENEIIYDYEIIDPGQNEEPQTRKSTRMPILR